MLEDEEVYYSGNESSIHEEDEDLICSICFNSMTETESYSLECDHKFHTACILKWFRSKHDTCPLCRVHPSVKLRPPDIMHRAKTLMSMETNGSTSDQFVRSKMENVEEAERQQAFHEEELRRYKENFTRITKPKKEMILKEYRQLRKHFKEKSVPLLRDLDNIDEKDHTQRQRIVKLIRAEKKKKRQAMRDIGLHNIEVAPQIVRVVNSSES